MWPSIVSRLLTLSRRRCGGGASDGGLNLLSATAGRLPWSCNGWLLRLRLLVPSGEVRLPRSSSHSALSPGPGSSLCVGARLLGKACRRCCGGACCGGCVGRRFLTGDGTRGSGAVAAAATLAKAGSSCDTGEPAASDGLGLRDQTQRQEVDSPSPSTAAIFHSVLAADPGDRGTSAPRAARGGVAGASAAIPPAGATNARCGVGGLRRGMGDT